MVYLQLLFECEVFSGRIQLVKELLPPGNKKKNKSSMPEAVLVGFVFVVLLVWL